MPPAGFLENPHLKFLLFGGKGGVGKTTTAVAAALRQAAARRTTGEQVLLVSTDPAHSLGDSLSQPIGDEITPVRGLGTLRLFAWEVDATRRLEHFKARYGEVLKTIADRGTYLDQDDIASFFDLSLPGIDELMVIIELADLVRQGAYGLIVVDTAPTGHTLRLLGLPALMEQWIHLLDLMLEKHRYMLQALARRRRGPPPEDEAERFLQKMSADQGLLRTLLADPRHTEFVPVLIPEAMALEETGRLIDALAGLRVPVHTLVVNRVAIWRDCPFCQARHREQAPALAQIEARFAKQGYHRAWAPWAARPVQGLPALEAYAQGLLEESTDATCRVATYPTPPAHLRLKPDPTLPPPRRPHPTPRAPAAAFAPLWKDLDCGLLLFGGKGGVGKTTLAAAAALGLVERHPGQRVLIFSTDPAHSLSDSFMQPIGNQVTPVAGGPGLHALEMDAAVFMEELKQLYTAQTDEAFEAFVGRRGVDAPFDRAVMEALVSTTPPGLDELMALLKIMDFMKEGRFDRYILDLAPTGHALRFLETPGLVRQWFQALTRLVLKYRSVVSLTKVGEWLLEQSRRLRRVEQLLPDPGRCRFVAVSIPEAMAVDETERLLGRLTGLAIACPIVIANMVMPPTECSFCRAARDEQQPHLAKLARPGHRLIQVPFFPHPIQGVEQLRLVTEWLGGRDLTGLHEII